MVEQVLEKIFNRIQQIPTFPKTAQKALALLQEEEVDYNELERVIKSDPGIAANFLKIANSPAIGVHQKITSLLQAFTFLGVDQIRFILLASVSKEYFNKDFTGYGTSAQDIWLHSLATGLIAEEVANILNFSPEKKETLYIAAILHDIGKIVLDLYINLEMEEFKKVLETNPDWDFLQIEWLVLGIDHGLVGANLFKMWNFPEAISFCVRAHHDFSLMLESKTAAVVGFSNILATYIGIGGGIDSFYYKIPKELLKFLNLDSDQIMQIFKKVFINIYRLKKTFVL